MVGKNCQSKDRMAMDLNERFIQIGLIFLLLIPSSHSQLFLDAITPNQPLGDGRALISSRKFFALGFLRIGSFDNYYLAVWFNKVVGNTVVWVANGDKPLSGSPGVLAIKDDGGLAVYANNSSSTTPVWSANVTLSSNNFTAKLRDTGNLVLLENGSQRVVWQSFDYPSNTVLPSMKIGLDRRAGINRFLTSWKSKDDPGTGSFTWGWDTSGFPQMTLNKRGTRVWRAGPWTGERFNGIPGKISSYKGLYDVSIVNNEDELTTMYTSVNDSLFTRAVVDESGIIQRFMWNDQKNEWILLNSEPNDWCDNYGKCGPNSNCDLNSDYTFPCTCLPSFEPKSPRDWNLRIGLAGCVRKTGVSTCRSGEGFVQVKSVKMPDTSTAKVNLSMTFKACELKCLMDCSCTAYSGTDDEESKNGCLTWHGDLMDMRTFPNVDQIINVRVDAITVAQNAKSSGAKPIKKGRLTISLSVLAAVLLVTLLCWLIWMKIKGKRGQDEHPFILDTGLTYFDESDNGSTTLDESRINSELLFFHLNTIEKATNNFSLANKLGEGGFGSVYKGVLPNGKEIAVKRLSKNSGQGVEEFKNEVLLIAKLQHRNLVRILGSCIEHDEKILIYEYLCNKSLDSFIFNETKRAALDWTRRYTIIFGIARGILYLHEDSRLRIIHRDLKASNVLLDGSMNPKVADFGMARMFRGEQSEANTNHVVGTYGYMSPEYAMEGLFSVKSDVYSFGILLLEIITSKKNAGYHHEEHPDFNLVGHVWELWKEGRTLEVIDSFMCKLNPADQVQRCIQIALLCVQEFPSDRPSMSEVVFMLGNDASLPSPSRPAFVLKRMNAITDPSSSEGVNSINDVTCTTVEAR